jgi:uncharacterized protein YuzE
MDVYVRISDNTIKSTVPQDDEIIIDYDANGDLVGIEIIDAVGCTVNGAPIEERGGYSEQTIQQMKERESINENGIRRDSRDGTRAEEVEATEA